MSSGPGWFLLPVIAIAASNLTAVAAAATDVSGLIDIGGGRKMYLECRGVGAPMVVLIAGLKASADDRKRRENSADGLLPEWPTSREFAPTIVRERRSAKSRAGVIRCCNL